jgi:protein-tyrosine-phosphatase
MKKKSRILIFDTGNVNIWVMTCAFLKSFDPDAIVVSTANYQQGKVALEVVEVLKESMLNPCNDFLSDLNDLSENSFDFILLVGDSNSQSSSSVSRFNARTVELTFINKFNRHDHYIKSIDTFREIRDEIKNETFKFYRDYLR